MELNSKEVEILLKGLVRTSQNCSMHLSELRNLFKQQIGVQIGAVATNFNFETDIDLLKSMKEFEVYGCGLETTVKCKESDHISEMNRRSKKNHGKHRYGLSNQFSGNVRRPFTGVDQYAFSGSEDTDDDFFAYGDEEKLKDLVLSSKLLPNYPLIKTTDKTTPTIEPLSSDKLLIIRVLELVNPHRFWFSESEEYIKLDELMAKMQKQYTKDGEDFKLAQKDVQKGLLCAVSYSDIWHRGKIIKELSTGMARVCYIDFGTVEDVKVEKRVRYLTEEYIELPAMARRGVLSHVQPKQGIWSEESINFFRENVIKKKLEVKIFKKSSRDSSYFMAMKTTAGNEKVLIANALMKGGFCDYDEKFCEREVVNEKEFEFEDFEMGKNLEVQKESIQQDSWLPTPQKSSDQKFLNLSGLSEISRQMSSTKSEKTPSKESIKAQSTPVPSELKFQRSPRQKLEFNGNSKPEGSSVVSAASLKTTSFVPLSVSRNSASSKMSFKNQNSAEKVPETTPKISQDVQTPPQLAFNQTNKKKSRQIIAQSFKNFKAGSSYQIYIHSIEDTAKFFFFLKDEFSEIRTFLKSFNSAYTNKPRPNDIFTLGSDVVTYSDENYCRGRIIEELENGKKFKIFLLDFGVVVERTKGNIYKLYDDWLNRQASVYAGSLVKAPENFELKTRENLLEKVEKRFVKAFVTKIEVGVVYITLVD